MRKMYSEQDIADIVEKVLSKGVDKVNPQALVGLTHSFAELDETLQALIESAIETQQEVSCTEPQWNVIKTLFDKSLYFAYNGNTLIKSIVMLHFYQFGWLDEGNSGTWLEINYDYEAHTLYARFTEN